MSLQSSTGIWKWKFTTAVRHGLYSAAVIALFLVLPQGHSQTNSQTIGTRTTLAIARETAGTTFTVTVKDPTGATVSDGSVSLVSGGASLGAAFVNANGTATLTLDKLPANMTQVTAVYSGSNLYAASASASANVQANATTGLPDFAITANPASLSLTAGSYGASIITVTPENGFSQQVTLSLSGLPGGTTSTFTPSIVTANSTTGPVPSTLQIQTTALSGALNPGPLPGGNAGHLAYAMVFPGVLALVGMGALRKRGGNGLRLLGLVVLLLASASGLTACSQRYSYLNHPPAKNPGTPAGSYTVVVTAYSNNGGQVTSHFLNIALTVK